MRMELRGFLLVLGLALTGGAHATLIDRGNGLIYDDVLDITWLQNANLDGLKDWDDAVGWADALVYEGYDDWRLPYISVAAGAGPLAGSPVNCLTATEADCQDNELGYMYYHNLDGNLGDDLSGNPVSVNDIQFQDVQFLHWSGTEGDSNFAWVFVFGNGDQGVGPKLSANGAWAVRPGDVLSVPEPSIGLLLAIGLVGVGVSRRRSKTRRG